MPVAAQSRELTAPVGVGKPTFCYAARMHMLSTALRLLICLSLVVGGGPRAHAASHMDQMSVMQAAETAMPAMSSAHCQEMGQGGHSLTSDDQNAPTAPQPDCCKAGQCHCLAPPVASALVGSYWLSNLTLASTDAPTSGLSLAPRQRQLTPPFKPPIA